MAEYLIGDLHLDHRKIIHAEQRPFNNIEEMNEALVFNWNATISPQDTVYFLGDLAFKTPAKWLRRLAGKVVIIKGNHDNGLKGKPYIFLDTPEREQIKELLLVHSPRNTPEGYMGWLAHGHTHSNSPLIDLGRRRVNLSAEMINYTPVKLADVLDFIEARLTLQKSLDIIRGVNND